MAKLLFTPLSIGGKLASYRLFSEEMSDIAARRLGVEVTCRTHLTPLPGDLGVIERVLQ